MTFRNDDEKHAWDLYVAGTAAREPSSAGCVLVADKLLEARRERENKPLGGGSRPGMGGGTNA